MPRLFQRGGDNKCRAIGFLNPARAGPSNAENDAHEGEGGDAMVVGVGGQEAFIERGSADHSNREHGSAEWAETAGGEGCKQGEGDDEKQGICPDRHAENAVSKRVAGEVAVEFAESSQIPSEGGVPVTFTSLWGII